MKDFCGKNGAVDFLAVRHGLHEVAIVRNVHCLLIHQCGPKRYGRGLTPALATWEVTGGVPIRTMKLSPATRSVAANLKLRGMDAGGYESPTDFRDEAMPGAIAPSSQFVASVRGAC